jgi:CheY-like chemotaxis protein
MQYQAMNILLQADEEQARLVAAALVDGKVRASVRVARNDAEVLASLRGSMLPDMVLLNPSLPGGDAVGLLREIRSDPHLRRIPIIVLADPAGPAPEACDGTEPDAPARVRLPLLVVDLFAMVRSIDQLGFCITTEAAAQR